MIAQQVVHRARADPRAHGNSHRTRIIVRLHRGRAARPLEVVPDVNRRCPASRLLDSHPVGVVHVAGGYAPGHRRQPVLGVVGQRDILTAADAPGRVAVGIVPILLHATDVRQGVFVGRVPVGELDP